MDTEDDCVSMLESFCLNIRFLRETGRMDEGREGGRDKEGGIFMVLYFTCIQGRDVFRLPCFPLHVCKGRFSCIMYFIPLVEILHAMACGIQHNLLSSGVGENCAQTTD